MKLETLKKRDHFVRVSKLGVSVPTKGVVTQALEATKLECHNKKADEVLVGYTVSRKVGSAVVRNRVKRRLRELAKEICCDTDLLNSDYCYVFIARHAAVRREYLALRKDMKYSLHQINDQF